MAVFLLTSDLFFVSDFHLQIDLCIIIVSGTRQVMTKFVTCQISKESFSKFNRLAENIQESQDLQSRLFFIVYLFLFTSFYIMFMFFFPSQYFFTFSPLCDLYLLLFLQLSGLLSNSRPLKCSLDFLVLFIWRS